MDQLLLDLFPDDLRKEVPELRPDNPLLQTVISGLKKFTSYTADPKFVPKPGEPYPAQALIKLLMEITPCLLLFWEPGAGKTGAMAEVAEEFRRRYEVTYIDGTMPTSIRKTVVFAINPTVRKELKRLLFCKHTKGHYFSSRITNAVSKTQQKKEITMALGTWYQFYTYISIISILQEKKLIDKEGNVTDLQGFRAEMDHKLYLCDEIHVLQQDKETGGAGKRKNIVFRILRNIRHYCTNSKMILATGTPINKDPVEILSILELLNDRDIADDFEYGGKRYTIEQLTDANMDQNIALEILRPLFQGRVSYMVSPAIDEQAVAIGDPLIENGKETGLKLYYTYMSPYQTDIYLRRVAEEDPKMFGNPSQRSKEGSAAYKFQIEASIFTYPDVDPDTGMTTATVGSDAYKHYIIDEEAPKKIKPGKPSAEKPNFRNIWRSPKLMRLFRGEANPQTEEGRIAIINNVAQYSAVFASILSNIEGVGTLVAEEGKMLITPGCVFVFFVSVENGVAPFSIALEALGYERFLGVQVEKEQKPGDPCGSDLSRNINISKNPRRYGVITSRTDDTINDALRELQMSPENVRAEYIRVIIVSSMARAGINVFHCQQGHIGEGHWSPGVEIQGEKRFLRLDGFTELKKLMTGPFHPKIFRHVAWPQLLSNLEEYQEQLKQLPPIPYYQKLAQHISNAILLQRSYIGRQEVDRPGVPPVGKLVYSRMYDRKLRNAKIYLIAQALAMDAWINRPVIELKFSDEDHPYFQPAGKKAEKIVTGDYYLTPGGEGEKEISDLSRQLAAGIVDQSIDLLNLQQSTELMGGALVKLLNADAPLECEKSDNIQIQHVNSRALPFAVNYKNGMLYQQADLGPSDQLLGFYRKYSLLSEISPLRKVNVLMGESAETIFVDLIRLTDLQQIRHRLISQVPQETVVTVIELIIEEALKKGYNALPKSYQQILLAYNNVIFVLPRDQELHGDISEQIDTSSSRVSINEKLAFDRLFGWMMRPDVYRNFWQGFPYIFSLYTYLNSAELMASPVEKVIVHMAYYVTEDLQQQFGAASAYTRPFDGRETKNVIRISNPLGGQLRWVDFSSVDVILYQELIQQTINALIMPAKNKVWAISDSYLAYPDIMKQFMTPENSIYVVVYPDGLRRIVSPQTPSGRDLACMDAELCQTIIYNMKPTSPEIDRLKERQTKGVTEELRRTIWNNLVQHGAVFNIVNWGLPDTPEFSCHKS